MGGRVKKRRSKNLGYTGGAVTCLGDLVAQWPHLSGD